jgi:hypothetical protein
VNDTILRPAGTEVVRWARIFAVILPALADILVNMAFSGLLMR